MKKQYYIKKRGTAAIPFYMRLVRGAVGKEFVIKHCRYGIVKTKYPDMTNIVASKEQRSCRDLFKAAVKKAQQVMRNPEQKEAWLKKIKQKHRLFNQLVKHFMLLEKKAARKRELEGKYLVRSCFTTGCLDTAPAKKSPVASEWQVEMGEQFSGTKIKKGDFSDKVPFSGDKRTNVERNIGRFKAFVRYS